MSLLKIYVGFNQNIKFKLFLKIKFKSQYKSSCLGNYDVFSQIIKEDISLQLVFDNKMSQ